MGLLLFWGAVLILTHVVPIVSAIVAVPLLIVYVLLYLGSLADLALKMMFHFRLF